MNRIGPHSRPDKLAVVDGRRAEAKLMKAIRAELAQHVGGTPSATQRMLIERCAMLSLRIQLMDRIALKEGAMTEKSAREYLCWTNALSRLLRQLGLKGTPRVRTIAEIMSSPQAAA